MSQKTKSFQSAKKTGVTDVSINWRNVINQW
jgi:hypothetical protein